MAQKYQAERIEAPADKEKGWAAPFRLPSGLDNFCLPIF